MGSASVCWWNVHEFVQPWLEIVNSWPTVGTPVWCDLKSDQPAKIAALLDAAQHWALRVETCQEARCDASKSISAAADWTAIGRERLQLNAFYESRPWLKRIGGGHV